MFIPAAYDMIRGMLVLIFRQVRTFLSTPQHFKGIHVYIDALFVKIIIIAT